MLNVNFEAMNLEQKIDRVLTEYNFDRMSFDEAKQELLNLHSVSKRLEPNYDNPKNGFVKLRADDCGNEIG